MLGTGTWSVNLNTNVIHGPIIVEIKYINGEYEANVLSPEFSIPCYKLIKVEKPDENTLVGHFEIADLPGKYITIKGTFTENKIEGFVKFPVVGRIPFDADKI